MRWSLNARGFDLVDEGRRLIDLQLNDFKASHEAPSPLGNHRPPG